MSTAFHNIFETTDYPAIIQQKDQLIAAFKEEISILKEQLAWFKKQIFGQKSERIVADLETQPLLPEIATADLQAKEPEKEKISYERSRRQKNRGVDTISFPDDLPDPDIETLRGRLSSKKEPEDVDSEGFYKPHYHRLADNLPFLYPKAPHLSQTLKYWKKGF